ncbi:predicted protein [Histoplasma capsulatum var. duboisii H88]|uniref:Predicted protein n=1 Tax=Ajellomyces capsulatus (strain H88) TaxID=544711 RepID=F0UVC9_AJEC8|nr:predicted protein [Histoplasma capsulatum var. duboisii H88]
MQAESTIIPDSRKSTIPRRHVFSRGGSWAKHLQPMALRVHSGRKIKKHASFTIYGRELRPDAAAHFIQRVVLLGPPRAPVDRVEAMKFVKALAAISEAGLLLSVMERMRVEVRIPWVKFARENIHFTLLAPLWCLFVSLSSISFVVIHHYLSRFFICFIRMLHSLELTRLRRYNNIIMLRVMPEQPRWPLRFRTSRGAFSRRVEPRLTKYPALRSLLVVWQKLMPGIYQRGSEVISDRSQS